MTYYTIIEGVRYEATLLSVANFFMRGRGDGRISESDAKELWRIAKDGGRVTEIEERTLRYLLEHTNWTDPARDWILEELEKEEKELKSYYKIIDGLKYDRRLLEKAEELTAGAGDGRISFDDARVLVPIVGDMGDVRLEEERTILYLLDNYSWTEKARTFFFDAINPISRERSFLGKSRNFQFELGVPRLAFQVNRTELFRQATSYTNVEAFDTAYKKAIENLLTFEGELSFRSMVKNAYGIPPEIEARASDFEKQLRLFLEEGRMLFYYGEAGESEYGRAYGTPTRGELIAEHWIFILELFDRTDDFFWIFVLRDGTEAPYNNADGPNFS